MQHNRHSRRNFESRSRVKDDPRSGTSSPNYHFRPTDFKSRQISWASAPLYGGSSKASEKKSERFPGLGSLREKKGDVSYGDLLTINGAKYPTFQEPAGAAGLSKPVRTS
ncbi:hypothetical protein TNCV_5056291 [Trichonephila clavipes]|nr:hypothetical protein TNCV_5056291 [Trichonephila clavipes]